MSDQGEQTLPHPSDDQPNSVADDAAPIADDQPNEVADAVEKPTVELKPTTVFASKEIEEAFKKVSLQPKEEDEQPEEPINDRKIMLKSSDGKVFEVEESAIRLSDTIKHMIEDDVVQEAIPVVNVTADTLGKVIEYCRRHSYRKFRDEEEMKKWDEDFVAVDRRTLSRILLAANFLGVEGLLDLASKAFAMVIKDMSVEEVRAVFGIVNDFTPEEEEKVRRENPYGFA